MPSTATTSPYFTTTSCTSTAASRMPKLYWLAGPRLPPVHSGVAQTAPGGVAAGRPARRKRQTRRKNVSVSERFGGGRTIR
jgi:hypothetical protein